MASLVPLKVEQKRGRALVMRVMCMICVYIYISNRGGAVLHRERRILQCSKAKRRGKHLSLTPLGRPSILRGETEKLITSAVVVDVCSPLSLLFCSIS